MEWYLFQFEPGFFGTVMIRLLVACVLGGVIGYERESSQYKPAAGFRTHILVSLGSCLVMLISQYAITAYQGIYNVDPTRIGAQVVSGIGFLGAGAIIRHGVSVKGLTTAASIWTVACVGLACGIGFFAGAGFATLLIWLVLIYLKTFENKIIAKGKPRIVEIEAAPDSNVLPELSCLFKEIGYKMKHLEVAESATSHKQKIQCWLDAPSATWDETSLINKIMEINGVIKVYL